MSIKLETFLAGESRMVEATITDYPPPIGDGLAFDPDTHIIKLLRPDGTQEGDDMTSPSGGGPGNIGTFWQEITIPAGSAEDPTPTGEWMVEWWVSVAGKLTPERIRIKVVD